MDKLSNVKTQAAIGILIGFVLVANGCSPALQTGVPLEPTAKIEKTDNPLPQQEITQTPTETVGPYSDWETYSNDTFKISFQYPRDWYGPDVYENETDLRLMIGSDQVYPYGTSREDQISTVENSYYITIQYRKNQNNTNPDDYQNQPWMSGYLALLDLKDGESISTARALDIRVREVTLGAFTGLEYISTLSETAQTEHFYARRIVLFDQNMNALEISGSPNNVQIGESEDWRNVYRSIDEENYDIFRKVFESIVVE